MKATAKAPANIALIKYWGKQDEKQRLPLNSSISMNLSHCYTISTVEFSSLYKKDQFQILGEKASVKEKERVIKHLDRIRKKSGISLKARVVTKNSFPKSSGLASSASGFAALTLAATKAAGLDLKEKELSILARLGSGSASRSIPDGFVEWKKGKTSKQSYAYSLYPPDYWDLRDLVTVVIDSLKKVSSTEAQRLVHQSSYFSARLKELSKRIQKIKQAFRTKDFPLLGKLIEEEAVSLHVVAMTSKPAIFYWNETTMRIIKAVQKWREQGLMVYFTIDAGPNVHLFCQAKDEREVLKKVKEISGVLDVITNKPARGGRLVSNHLF